MNFRNSVRSVIPSKFPLGFRAEVTHGNGPRTGASSQPASGSQAPTGRDKVAQGEALGFTRNIGQP
jgi:hypothetical protein